jgi:Methyltransferase FkbM domain
MFAGCLSPYPFPSALRFKSADTLGGLTDKLTDAVEAMISDYRAFESVESIQCFPLGDLLASIGVDRVDYLSLDVHGAELPVLETLDLWQFRDRLHISIINVEVYGRNSTEREVMFANTRRFFAGTGLYRELQSPSDYDLVFMRTANSSALTAGTGDVN